ncbi:hypothetical protein [Microvirga sp. BSC39]|uniref:DUF6894 family protein n=1 Tax=Microvirga sp. BSC39 TaxID=1549810 RepID=UPI001269A35A|nr:hypothetical protein [Microvirga sp. BSC39]
MLYFFHVQLKEDVVCDTSGVELPDIESARSIALQSARELVAEAVRLGRDTDFEAILVADVHGSPIIHVAAGDVVPNSLRHQTRSPALL